MREREKEGREGKEVQDGQKRNYRGENLFSVPEDSMAMLGGG